ncbi:MAG: hypothetical protein L0H84_08255 [Pseudonocardia sp.]|nr:hypothetical protein [Pseudonocardia sp.]
MANALYDAGRNAFLTGDIDWLADTIKAVLVDTADYTVNLATHDFLSDIPVAARVDTTAAFTGKTAVAGVADAADIAFVAATGDLAEAIVIYKDTGVDTTSPLIAYIDSATGLPVQPNSGDINLIFSNAADRVFKL